MNLRCRQHSGIYDISRDEHIPRDDAKRYEMFAGEMTTKPHFTLHGSGPMSSIRSNINMINAG